MRKRKTQTNPKKLRNEITELVCKLRELEAERMKIEERIAITRRFLMRK
jgi:hypothetical protein